MLSVWFTLKCILCSGVILLFSSKNKLYNVFISFPFQDAIYRIKNYFNKQFDEVYHKKEQEIGKIKEKNNRIYKIIDDLNLSNEKVYKPELGVIEKPELLLTVQDDEVKYAFNEVMVCYWWSALCC